MVVRARSPTCHSVGRSRGDVIDRRRREAVAEQGEISSQHGRFAIGILLFQDLATIPLLVAADSWSRQSVDPFDLVRRLGLAALALATVAIIARPLVRTVLAGAARSHSTDLFLLTALLVALGAAYFAHLAGLALPIGAFIAGMMIGGSDFRHRVEDDLRPFRDILVGLFFVTVGMAIDLRSPFLPARSSPGAWSLSSARALSASSSGSSWAGPPQSRCASPSSLPTAANSACCW